MPSHIPRKDTQKKHIQLEQREQELKHALRSGFDREKLSKAAEKLRAAWLSLLKAEVYWLDEAKIRGVNVEERLAKIHEEVRSCLAKSMEQICSEYTTQIIPAS